MYTRQAQVNEYRSAIYRSCLVLRTNFLLQALYNFTVIVGHNDMHGSGGRDAVTIIQIWIYSEYLRFTYLVVMSSVLWFFRYNQDVHSIAYVFNGGTTNKTLDKHYIQNMLFFFPRKLAVSSFSLFWETQCSLTQLVNLIQHVICLTIVCYDDKYTIA